MNENFIQTMTDKKISAYSLAKNTGIPYTTISRLKTQKLDINKCAVETVVKIAKELETPIESLLNPVLDSNRTRIPIKGFKRKEAEIVVKNGAYHLNYNIDGKKGTSFLLKVNQVNKRFVPDVAKWECDFIKKEQARERLKAGGWAVRE